MQYKITKGIRDNYLLEGQCATSEDDVLLSLTCVKNLDWKKDKVLIIFNSENSLIINEDFLSRLSTLFGETGISDCIVINSTPATNSSIAHPKIKYEETVSSFIKRFKSEPFEESIVMMIETFEGQAKTLVDYFSSNICESSMKVNLDALVHNLNYYKSSAAPSTKIMAMVKASGYGHGMLEVAHHLKNRVEYFGVAYVNEGITLRKKGIETPIMVMNTSSNDFYLYNMFHLEPEIYSLSLLKQLIAFLEEKQTVLPIHLEFDTGMNRLGFSENEIDEVIELIKSSKFIELKTVYSHMASAEDAAEDSFNKGQMKKFDIISEQLKSELGFDEISHIRNSAGALRYPDSPTNMVRLGIGLYGVDNNNLFQDRLKTVSAWKTVISQIRKVSKGETVGYNRTFKAENDMEIATIAVGYADGFKRSFSNGKGLVKIRDQITPVVGRVNMDMTMVDVTNMNVRDGDEVIIYNDDSTLRELAKNADTIPYEIFTSIGERVKREYVFNL